MSFQRQIAKKNFKSKSKACQIFTGLTCLSNIKLQLFLAVKFGCFDSESCPRMFPSFACCHLSGCALQLESEQTPFSQTGCQFVSAAWHKTWFETSWFVSMPYFAERPINGWISLLKDWRKLWTVLVWNKFSLFSVVKSIEIFNSNEKAVPEFGQKSLAIDFAPQPWAVPWVNLLDWSPGDSHRLKLGLKLELCHLTNKS